MKHTSALVLLSFLYLAESNAFSPGYLPIDSIKCRRWLESSNRHAGYLARRKGPQLRKASMPWTCMEAEGISKGSTAAESRASPFTGSSEIPSDFTAAPNPNKAPAIMQPKRYRSSDWLHNLVSLPWSITLIRIRSHLIANTVVAVCVWLLFAFKPAVISPFVKGMNPSAHGLISGALGLMLVFRTNSAYDRFWEARKVWGSMIVKLREIARIAHSSMYGWDREHCLQLIGSFAPVLLQHLRTGAGGKGSELQKEALKGLLSESDVEVVWNARNRPYVIIKMIGAIVRKAYTNTGRIAQHFKLENNGANLNLFECMVLGADLHVERTHVEHMLLSLAEGVGSAERIVKTSVPLSYSRHTSRFLSVWCFTLPFVLVESFKWRMIPAVVGICWALLCIEEVGNIIEDPFNLPFMLDRPMKDELKLERSFKNIRSDIMDRLPALSPFLQHYGGDFLCYKDYDVGEFHEKQRVTRGRSNFESSTTDAANRFVWQDLSESIDPTLEDAPSPKTSTQEGTDTLASVKVTGEPTEKIID